jgi:DinB superfamily
MKDPNENLPEIFAFLECMDRALRKEMDGMDLSFSPATDVWSGGQVLAHLIRTEKYFYPLFRLIPKLKSVPWLIRALDRINIRLCKLAGMKLNANGEKKPEGLAGLRPGYNGRFVAPRFLRPGRTSDEPARLWTERQAVRNRTIGAIVRAGEDTLRHIRFSHPELGSLTLLEMVIFLGKHEAWHLEQLRRIQEAYETAGGRRVV